MNNRLGAENCTVVGNNDELQAAALVVIKHAKAIAAPVEHGSIRAVDGFIDLAYQDDSGIHIIDYKTDASIGDHNLPHYREQLTAYTELMRRGIGQNGITASVLHLTESSANLIPILAGVARCGFIRQLRRNVPNSRDGYASKSALNSSLTISWHRRTSGRFDGSFASIAERRES